MSSCCGTLEILGSQYLWAEIGLKDFLQTLCRIDVHGKRDESLRVLGILIQELKGAHCVCRCVCQRNKKKSVSTLIPEPAIHVSLTGDAGPFIALKTGTKKNSRVQLERSPSQMFPAKKAHGALTPFLHTFSADKRCQHHHRQISIGGKPPTCVPTNTRGRIPLHTAETHKSQKTRETSIANKGRRVTKIKACV